MQQGYISCEYIYKPKARPEPSPAKTKMKVETNSAMVALIESGCVASSALPKAYLRVAISNFLFYYFFTKTCHTNNYYTLSKINMYFDRKDIVL
jgi:hypothetical protein